MDLHKETLCQGTAVWHFPHGPLRAPRRLHLLGAGSLGHCVFLCAFLSLFFPSVSWERLEVLTQPRNTAAPHMNALSECSLSTYSVGIGLHRTQPGPVGTTEKEA